MIIVTWRISVASGKVNEGLEWTKSTMATMTKAGIAPSKWWILRPRSGEITRFTLAAQFASMAEFEEHIAKRDGNSSFQALSRERMEAGWTTGIEIIFAEVIEEG